MATEKYKICPGCGEHNRPSALECRNCELDLTGVKVVDSETAKREAEQPAAHGDEPAANAAVTELVRICEECGAKNPPQARKCSKCGEDISDIIPSEAVAEAKKAFSYELKSVDGAFSVTIDSPLTIIGREAGLKEYLGTKMYVSRHHAELTVVAGKVLVKNMSATNKTFVNNQAIPDDEPFEIADGDELGLGGKLVGGKRQEQAAYFTLRVMP